MNDNDVRRAIEIWRHPPHDVQPVPTECHPNSLHSKPPSGCPVNNLPTELLAYIFYIGTYLHDGSDDDGSKSIHGIVRGNAYTEHRTDGERGDKSTPEHSSQLPFQVLVSHVCTLWRQVAIDSPTLWTSLSFGEGPPFEKSQVWVERSKQLPLTIEFECIGSRDPDSDMGAPLDEFPSTFSMADLATILDIIIPHVNRWRKLDVLVNVYSYMHLILSRLSECPGAPLLELIQLNHYEEDEEDEDVDEDDDDEMEKFQPAHLKQFQFLFQGNTPNLKHVVLWGVHVAWSTPMFRHLVGLELAYHAKDVRPSWEEFSRILRDSPRLEYLTLSLSGPAGSPAEWPGEVVEMPSLMQLSLAYHDPAYVSSLVQALLMPNLKFLALDFDNDDFTSLAHQLAATIPGTSRSVLSGLEYLKISGLPCSLESNDVIYEQLTNVKSLHLNCTYLGHQFFEKLMSPAPSNSRSPKFYCPNLSSVTVSGIGGSMMREFVERRSAAGFPIERIFISEHDELSPEDEMWLKLHAEFVGYFEPSDTDDGSENETGSEME